MSEEFEPDPFAVLLCCPLGQCRRWRQASLAAGVGSFTVIDQHSGRTAASHIGEFTLRTRSRCPAALKAHEAIRRSEHQRPA